MIVISKWTIIALEFLYLCWINYAFAPVKAREILRKAGSTNFINYAEITIRMIPATALILYSDLSRYPEFSKFLDG